MKMSFVPSFISEELMNWEEYSRIVLEKCKEKELPYHACFELTPFCNFKCNMCYIRLDSEQARKQGQMLNYHQWIDLAKEAKQMGTLSLELTGGEAISRADFPIIYEELSRMGFIINLRTNGYLLNSDVYELLKKNKPQRIGITIYGASDETYQKVCDVKDGFSVVTSNILKLINDGFNVHLSMMVTNDNIDDREKLDKWAQLHDLKIKTHGGVIHPIRNAKRPIEQLRIRYTDEECTLSNDTGRKFPDIPDRLEYMNPFWMCNGFGSIFCISWDGRVTLCNTMVSIWKDPFISGLECAYKELYSELKGLQRPEKCRTCYYIDYCAACPSQLLSETGRPDHTCEEICRRARRRYKAFNQNRF